MRADSPKGQPQQGTNPLGPRLPSSGGAGDEGLLPLTRYWDIVLKRIWTIALVFVGVFALVAVYTFKQPKIYEARTSIIIDLSTPKVLGKDVQPVVELSSADYWNSDQFFETQYTIIKSRMVAEKVVETLGLADNLVFLGLDKIEDKEKLAAALERVDPVDVLTALTEVEPAFKSRLVIIKVRHTSPEMAQRLADAIAEAYQTQNIERTRESTYGAYDWLTTQYQEVKDKLEKSDQALYLSLIHI